MFGGLTYLQLKIEGVFMRNKPQPAIRIAGQGGQRLQSEDRVNIDWHSSLPHELIQPV